MACDHSHEDSLEGRAMKDVLLQALSAVTIWRGVTHSQDDLNKAMEHLDAATFLALASMNASCPYLNRASEQVATKGVQAR